MAAGDHLRVVYDQLAKVRTNLSISPSLHLSIPPSQSLRHATTCSHALPSKMQDPNSLSNLDQDLPNFAQHDIPIHSLPAEWLWCETWYVE
jgi:hypothetical protein